MSKSTKKPYRGRRYCDTLLVHEVVLARGEQAMGKPKKPLTGTTTSELQRLANRLAEKAAAELPPSHTLTLVVIGPGNPEDLVRNLSATAVRHARPRLLTEDDC